jgi:hypothetical protein
MNLCNFKFTEQRLKEIFVSQDEPHQGNIVDGDFSISDLIWSSDQISIKATVSFWVQLMLLSFSCFVILVSLLFRESLYLVYKKLGVKTRFVYLYFQKMDQILGKSQEIPNFELTNSVSDDSSVDTVDKCDQIGVVGLYIH